MRKNIFSNLSILFVLLFGLMACQKQTTVPSNTGGEEQIRVKGGIPLEMSIGVVPFNQPTSEKELITGYLPERQKLISYQSQVTLDELLRNSLGQSHHPYLWLPLPSKPLLSDNGSSENPQGLKYWADYGKECRVDLILVPQILTWQQREGSRAGVTKAAHVHTEFFLIDVRSARIFRRFVFNEEQEGLVNNMLNIGKFFERGAGWVTAEELTQEAIDTALEEMKLL